MRCVAGARRHRRGLLPALVALLALLALAPGASAEDPLAPETQIDTPPPAYVNSGDVSIAFSAPGSLLPTFECNLNDAGWIPCESPKSYALTDGSYSFEVRALDPFPDPTPATALWTVDTAAPKPTVTSGPPPVTNSTTADFLYDSDGAPTLECSLDPVDLEDPAAWESCKASYPVGNGPHTLHVRATDHAGNSDTTTHDWTVDTDAPTARIDLGTSGVVSSGSAAFSFSSDDADVAAFRCSIDGSPAEDCTSPRSYSGLADGPHEFSVYAVDAAGNRSASETASWTVERTPPEAPFLPPPPQEQPPAGESEPQQQQPQPEQRSSKPKVTHVSNERTRTWWSHVRRRSAVHRRPSRDSKRVGRLSRFTYYGFDDVVIVLKRVGYWTKVRYSGLGGRTGWVRSVALTRPRLTRTRVVVNRKRFTLTAYRNGKRVFRTRVGVGAKGSPTPAGRFFMRERLVPRDKGGLYGPVAWGTSTYSRYRTDWPGGGQVGIHGTDQPGLIPGRISNGCVRLPNRNIRRLDRIVRRGTPVRIR